MHGSTNALPAAPRGAPPPALPRQTTIPDPSPHSPRVYDPDGSCGACLTRGALVGVIPRDHPMLLALVAWQSKRPAPVTTNATNSTTAAAKAPARAAKPRAQLSLFGAEALTYHPTGTPPPPVREAPPAFPVEPPADLGIDPAVPAAPTPFRLPRGRHTGMVYTHNTAFLCAACTRRVVAALVHTGQPVDPVFVWALCAP